MKIGEGHDKDQRNYMVTSEKLYSTGYRCEYSLEKGVDEILALCKNLQQEEIKTYGNY